MMTPIYAGALLLFQCFVAGAAFVPRKTHRCLVHYEAYDCQKHKITILANNLEDDDPGSYNNIDQNQLLEPRPSLVRERIKNGNFLDVLQVSVVLFFLLTLWISGGSILSDYSSNALNNLDGPGKSRIYKHIDADKLLRDEFEREESKVIFE
jgi:hypothetical protein